jgi:Helix-turn-helix of DDE superfamily endonuclease
MAGVRFNKVQSRPTEFLDLTSLTPDEFEQLIPPFEGAFQAHMARWRLDGKPRTSRQFSVYKNCPLPTPEDRLFFLLTYLKTYSLQVVQGRLFGMGQSKANQWIHALLPALQVALHTLGNPLLALWRPWRNGSASRWPTPCHSDTADRSTSTRDRYPRHSGDSIPLLPMTAPRGASCAPKTLLNRPIVLTARKKTTR